MNETFSAFVGLKLAYVAFLSKRFLKHLILLFLFSQNLTPRLFHSFPTVTISTSDLLGVGSVGIDNAHHWSFEDMGTLMHCPSTESEHCGFTQAYLALFQRRCIGKTALFCVFVNF
jgi:hypothetical protein